MTSPKTNRLRPCHRFRSSGIGASLAIALLASSIALAGGCQKKKKPAPPPPPLSKDALSGSVPLRTFGQLKQLWQARTTEGQAGDVMYAVVEGEVNYLINPSHPDFAAAAKSPPTPFVFDPRLK